MTAGCPELSELEQFADGDVARDQSTLISDHILQCAACRELLDDVRENNRISAKVRDVLSRMDQTGAAAALPQTPPQIGCYRILREIGRGGMGIVYEAEQANPRRRVAIKVLHAGFDSDGRIARMFQREAHALARLKHPSIAAIYEASQANDGRSFFAMELVQGEPLTAFARRMSLGTKEKLALFQSVCEAIAYAHQRGVIHRDLKPENILVQCDVGEGGDGGTSVINDSGRPKILDFGLAKLLEPDESMPAVTSPLEAGRVQGTLPYMSPEQVRGELAEIDVRSDVYSLGVVLYELLTGRLPYAVERGQLAKTAQTICEATPAAMGPAYRGDIETIVLKALEKEPARRFSSASALADDIGRYLTSQPIHARPPTLLYQVGKLVQRHRVPAALVTAMLLLVVGFAISMGVLYSKAKANLDRATNAELRAEASAASARHEADVATRIKDYLVGIFRVSDPEIGGGNVTARQLLDRGAERIRTELAADPAVQASMMHTMGCVYDNLGLYQPARALLSDALRIRISLDPRSLEVADSASTLALVLRRLEELDGSELAYKTAITIMRERGGLAGDVHTTSLLQGLAEVQSLRGDLEDAERAFEELVVILRKTPNGRLALPATLNSWSGVLAARGDYASGIPLLREASELEDGTDGHSRATATRLRGNLAWLLAQSGANDEAETLIHGVLDERRRMLPPRHPELATSLITLAVVHMNRGRFAEAEPLCREACEIRSASLGPNQVPVAEAKAFLGQCLTGLSQFEEAERLLLESFATIEASLQSIPRDRVEAAGRLSELYRAWGRPADHEHWEARRMAAAR